MVDPEATAPSAPLRSFSEENASPELESLENASGEVVATRNARLLLAYDGAAFHGFAEDVGVTTVTQTLRLTLERIARHPIKLTGAGRTDAGVHAWGQVASVLLDERLNLSRVRNGVNALCGPSLVVREATWTTPEFNARFSARWRRYRYTVVNRPVPDPFRATTAWFVRKPLRLDAMQLACDPLIGAHDFSAFCRRPKTDDGEEPVSLVRTVKSATWTDLGDGLLQFEIVGKSFCHNQVRAIVGTLIETGIGKRTAGQMLGVLRSKDRSLAGTVAPAHGLCLWEVGYDN